LLGEWIDDCLDGEEPGWREGETGRSSRKDGLA